MWKRLLILAYGSLTSLHAQQSQDVQKLIEQWIKTEQLIGKEASQWKGDKARINDLLELYAKELVLLNQTLTESGASAEAFLKDKANKEESLKQSELARKATIAFMQKIQPRVRGLVLKFPTPLKDLVSEQIATIQTEIDNKSVRNHLVSTIRLIQAAEKFNRSFTVTKHSILLDKKKYNAEVFYLGLSKAFFIAGNEVGVGTPTLNGWQWKINNDLAEQIQLAFKVQAGTVSPALFNLPLKVKEVQP